MKHYNWKKKTIAMLIVLVCTFVWFGSTLPALALQSLQVTSFPALVLTDTRSTVDNYLKSNPELLTYQYTKPADSPTAPGDVFQPRMDGQVAASNPPVISEATTHVDPDNSFTLQGKNFAVGGGTRMVWVYGQTTANDGTYQSTTEMGGDANTITSAISASKPYGMYLAWVQNENGLSYPVRINAPNVSWISATQAITGAQVSLYGSNLSYQNGEVTSYVYLRPWGAPSTTASIAAQVVSVNPYKVTFVVPSGLTAGTDYEVWLHNGHGGDYGWSGPQKLRISSTDKYSWTGTTRDVTSYGATTAAGNDDTAAIQAAVNAAADGDIIYFPAGTFTISSPVYVNYRKLYFKGASKTTSIIYSATSFQDKNTGLFSANGSNLKFSDLNFKDDKLEGTNTPSFMKVVGNGQNQANEGAIVDNCNFDRKPRSTWNYLSDAICFFSLENIKITNNTFTGPVGPYLALCTRMSIKNNTFYGNWVIGNDNGPDMVKFEGPRMLDISSNNFYALDYVTDPNGTLQFGDYGFVRAIVAQIHVGPAKDLYVAENNCNRVGNPANNCGEVIMFEGPARLYAANASSASGTTVTFGATLPGTLKAGSVVSIVNGTGEGQTREVVSYAGSSLTVGTPWDITPDSTSSIMITDPFMNAAVYKNTINGFSNYITYANAGAGIQAYGNMVNFWAVKNTFSNLMSGIRCTPQYRWPNDSSTVDDFALFSGVIIEDNNITNVRTGIAIVLSYFGSVGSGTIPGRVANNCVIRNNTITNALNSSDPVLAGFGGDGISVGSLYREYAGWSPNPFWDGNWIKNTLVEKNTVTNASTAYIRMQRHQGSTILRANNLVGSNGSNAVVYDPNATTAISAPTQQNTPTIIPLGSSGGGGTNTVTATVGNGTGWTATGIYEECFSEFKYALKSNAFTGSDITSPVKDFGTGYNYTTMKVGYCVGETASTGTIYLYKVVGGTETQIGSFAYSNTGWTRVERTLDVSAYSSQLTGNIQLRAKILPNNGRIDIFDISIKTNDTVVTDNTVTATVGNGTGWSATGVYEECFSEFKYALKSNAFTGSTITSPVKDFGSGYNYKTMKIGCCVGEATSGTIYFYKVVGATETQIGSFAYTNTGWSRVERTVDVSAYSSLLTGNIQLRAKILPNNGRIDIFDISISTQ